MAYNGKYMHGMGWALVVMGSLNIILGIAADAAFASMRAYTTIHYVGAPIWNGIFVVITGILAINSGKKPTSNGLMVAVMVLGILTIISAICCFALGVGGAITDTYYRHEICQYRYGYSCASASIALHVVNALLAFAEVVMAFVAAIMPCGGLTCCRVGNNPNDAPVVVYNQQGPNMSPGQAAYVIMQTGVPGAQGVPCTTISAAGGMPQQQVFIAQNPYPAGAPMQGYYGVQALPPYMQQSTIGAAAAAGQPPAGPPAETKTQPPA
ncbi:PREDICTED: uncharacterized protein LOC109477176 [Branchiostoma belcheri]|uniref:Uncharacterized protein LOC109477176 n=1 Tax=Branchiostoma belcheri TaxID=7741 RepID=A0A6P4ZS88_BRABE|nr:PREDICTED: uncharacterized protein LOC109477176 [Branchiostoma belcheri]